jgi:hypothetical protein
MHDIGINGKVKNLNEWTWGLIFCDNPEMLHFLIQHPKNERLPHLAAPR